MSRVTALWTAAAVAVLFALLVGTVMLRPALSIDGGGSVPDSPTTILTGSDDSVPAYDDDDSWDEDGEWEDEEYEEYEEQDDDD
jgi:hypothetical protein